MKRIIKIISLLLACLLMLSACSVNINNYKTASLKKYKTVYINSRAIHLPNCTLSKLLNIAKDFVVEADSIYPYKSLDDLLTPWESISIKLIDTSGNYAPFDIIVENRSNNDLPISQCNIVRIHTVHLTSDEQFNIKILKLKIGDIVTPDSLVEVFGEPDGLMSENGFTFLTWRNPVPEDKNPPNAVDGVSFTDDVVIVIRNSDNTVFEMRIDINSMT